MNNRYWLNRMVENTFGRENTDSFLKYPKLYDKIDKKLISKTAQKYLDYQQNKLSLIMTPERTMGLKAGKSTEKAGVQKDTP